MPGLITDYLFKNNSIAQYYNQCYFKCERKRQMKALLGHMNICQLTSKDGSPHRFLFFYPPGLLANSNPIAKSVQNPYKSNHFRKSQISRHSATNTCNFNALKCTDFLHMGTSATRASSSAIRTNPDDSQISHFTTNSAPMSYAFEPPGSSGLIPSSNTVQNRTKPNTNARAPHKPCQHPTRTSRCDTPNPKSQIQNPK